MFIAVHFVVNIMDSTNRERKKGQTMENTFVKCITI